MATNLQQKGLETTTSGKAGFITALYIVIVPIAGIFLRKKAPRTDLAQRGAGGGGTVSAFACTEGFSITEGDCYTMLLCSFCFSAHILIIDHFTQKVDGVELCPAYSSW